MKGVIVFGQELVTLRPLKFSQIVFQQGWEELKEMVSLDFWKPSGVAVQPGYSDSGLLMMRIMGFNERCVRTSLLGHLSH